MSDWWIGGRIEEAGTGRPLAGLIVRAFDRDLVFDDDLGTARTDAEGRFEIRFDARAFRDLAERHPDLYLRVYDSTGSWVVRDTRDLPRRNATRREEFQLTVAPGDLVPPWMRAGRR